MRPRLVIARLRAACPSFAGRVSGALDFPRAVGADDWPVPHAFVMLQAVTPTGDEILSPYDQEVNSQLTVALCVTSTADVRGQEASEALIGLFLEVRTALLGWTPDPNLYTPVAVEGFTYIGDEAWSRARSWAQVDVFSAAFSRDLT